MEAYICEKGIILFVTEFIEKFSNEHLMKLKKQFTISTMDRITKIPRRTPMWSLAKTETGVVIIFPKFSLSILKQRKIIASVQTQFSIGNKMAHEYVGRSTPNQKVVVDHITQHFRDNKGDGYCGFTLKMMPGSGKTFAAMDLISRIKRKTLIVVPNSYLLTQWVNLLKQYYPTANIGEMYGKRKTDGDIIVGIINTIADLESFVVSHKIPNPEVGKGKPKFIKQKDTVMLDDLFKQIGLTIFDESQMYVSKEFRKAFKRVHSRFTIGLSATPDIREDKLDRIHVAWLGPVLDAEQLPGYSVAQDKFQSVANMIHYHGKDENTQFTVREDGLMEYHSIIESIVNDPYRNELLIKEIMKLARRGKHVFVFSDRRTHLEGLFDAIQHMTIEEAVQLDLPEADRKIVLYGGSTEETIQKANNLSKIILTTYQYSSTGVSIQKMDALVLCTPRRSNMKQIINRVFRQGSDQSIVRDIIDIVDAKMPIKKQHLERIKAYKERGSVINKSVYKATDNVLTMLSPNDIDHEDEDEDDNYPLDPQFAPDSDTE